jgi:ACS family pantothenate transporter-like MFS transporter
MNGNGGLESWQWLFLFDGIIGIPVAIYGIIALPDFPSSTKAQWLNNEEKEMALI